MGVLGLLHAVLVRVRAADLDVLRHGRLARGEVVGRGDLEVARAHGQRFLLAQTAQAEDEVGVHDQVCAVVAGGEPAQRLGGLGDAPRLHGSLLGLERDDAAAEGLHCHPAVVVGAAHDGAQGRLGLGRRARALDAAAHHVVRDLGDIDAPQDGGDVVDHLAVVLAQARL